MFKVLVMFYYYTNLQWYKIELWKQHNFPFSLFFAKIATL